MPPVPVAQLEMNFDCLQSPAAVFLEFVLSMPVALLDSEQLLLTFTNQKHFNAAFQLLAQQHS